MTKTGCYHLPRFTGVAALRQGCREVPDPGPRRVLVRMRAWSLNYRDLMIATDSYGRALKPDVVPLSDGAGEVVGTGSEVTRWQPGERVVSVFMPDRTPEWGHAVHESSGGRVDHVVEVGGAGTLPQSLAAVRTSGLVTTIGVLAGGDGVDPGSVLRKGDEGPVRPAAQRRPARPARLAGRRRESPHPPTAGRRPPGRGRGHRAAGAARGHHAVRAASRGRSAAGELAGVRADHRGRAAPGVAQAVTDDGAGHHRGIPTRLHDGAARAGTADAVRGADRRLHGRQAFGRAAAAGHVPGRRTADRPRRAAEHQRGPRAVLHAVLPLRCLRPRPQPVAGGEDGGRSGRHPGTGQDRPGDARCPVALGGPDGGPGRGRSGRGAGRAGTGRGRLRGDLRDRPGGDDPAAPDPWRTARGQRQSRKKGRQ